MVENYTLFTETLKIGSYCCASRMSRNGVEPVLVRANHKNVGLHVCYFSILFIHDGLLG